MNRLILQGPQLDAGQAEEIRRRLEGTIERTALGCKLLTPNTPDHEMLEELRTRYPFDINLLPAGFAPERVRLLISDMDSTLISIECIDEIADFIGVKPQVAAITAAAMRGEIDFETSLQRRVALLKGLDAGALEHVYNERLRLNPGAETLLEGLRLRGIRFALVSGGFTFFTDRLKARLDIDFTHANTLAIEDDRINGEIVGPIVGAEGKADFLRTLCERLEIDAEQAIAVGDGANDLQMLRIAGLSIAYHAKPAVQAEADTAINHSGLDGVLGLLL